MRKLIIGVCAMDIKARSKPMRSILDRLVGQEPSHFEAIIFGDQVILEDPIEAWPLCDILIAFYSRGFPLDKATAYVNLRQPFCVNDLWMQYVLLDRRLVLAILDAIDVPTPLRLIVNRTAPEGLPERVVETVSRDFNLDFGSADLFPTNLSVSMLDPDTLVCGGATIRKPFVEKSADAEDHNVYVYFGSNNETDNQMSASTNQQQPGVRRLFRKVANKSSDFVPNLTQVRQDGSYIYERFLPIDNCEDVKVYTIGPYYAYAETRKSPVVDGVVIRNSQGKERRQATALSPEEQEMARRICMAFEQTICGFDILRVAGRSYVIDVNGWSLVKGSDSYYDKCGRIFRDTFLRVARRRHPSAVASMLSAAALSLPRSDSILEAALATQPAAGQWRLKYFCSVLRHGDRTPKQKFKLTTSNPVFLGLLPPDYRRGTQITLKERGFLQGLLQTCQEALKDETWSEEHQKYERIMEILRLKFRLASLKVQLRLCEQRGGNQSLSELQSQTKRSLMIIVKWGGEFTHAGRHQSTDLGESMRKELQILNRRILDDVKIFTSEERRVFATAEMFAKAFLPMAEVPPSFLEERRELLDDTCIPKEAMDVIKDKLRAQLQKRFCEEEENSQSIDGMADTDASVWVGRLIQVLRYHRRIYERKMATSCEADLLSRFRWCCSESPMLFRERWDVIFADLLGNSSSSESPIVFSPSRIPELYDSLKYEALHHRPFLEFIFTDELGAEMEDPPKEGLKELFVLVQRLFEYVGPREYGLTAADRLTIGRDISGPLLGTIIHGCRQVMEDTRKDIDSWLQTANVDIDLHPNCFPFPASSGKTRLYFTKESHMIALLNILLHSGIPIDHSQLAVTEEMLVRWKRAAAETKMIVDQQISDISIPDTANIANRYSAQSSLSTTGLQHYSELDYLSQICFEFYERIKVIGDAANGVSGSSSKIEPRWSMRIGLSHGAHTPHLMDLEWIPEDGRHALAVTPVKFITGYLEGEEALRILEQVLV